MAFRFERRASRAILFTFGHGRYLDAWSLLHVATGAVLGFTGLLLGLSWWTGLSLILVGLFLYEVFEAYMGIAEDVENALADVLCGALGAGGVYLYENIVRPVAFPLWAISLATALLILFLGWRSYLRRRLARAYATVQKKATKEKSLRRRDATLFAGSALAFIPFPALAVNGSEFAIVWSVSIFLCAVVMVRVWGR